MIAIFPLLSAAFVYMFESACSSMASVPMYNPSRHYYACLQLTLHLNAQFSFDCVTSHCAANGTSRLTRERAYQWEWLKTVCAFFFLLLNTILPYCCPLVYKATDLAWLDDTLVTARVHTGHDCWKIAVRHEIARNQPKYRQLPCSSQFRRILRHCQH